MVGAFLSTETDDTRIYRRDRVLSSVACENVRVHVTQ